MILVVPLELYFWIVTLCGLIYSGLSQVVRGKLVNMERMKELQKEMNKLNKEFIDAMKKKNTKRMDEIQLQQNKIMPEFNGMMMGQMKVMLVIIAIFMGFMWMLGAIDPYLNDDVSLEFQKSGENWCGEIPLSGGAAGPWYIGVKAFEGDAQRAENGTIIYHGVDGSSFVPYGPVTGEQMGVFADKESYSSDENAVVCASAPAYTDRVVATANSGTWFHIKLPLELPLVNRTLSGANIWFILVAMVGGLGISRIKNVITKKK